MQEKKLEALTKITLVVLSAAALLHTGFLLLNPNGTSESNWLGYTRSRFVLILLSTALPLFLLGCQKSVLALQNFATSANRTIGYLIAVLLGMFASILLELIIWPINRLPALGLMIKENFSASLCWLLISILLANVTLIICLSKSVSTLWIDIAHWVTGFTYIHLRIQNALTFRYAGLEGDAVQYIGYESLEHWLDSGMLFNGPRPFLLPLLGSLVGMDAYVMAWIQTLVSIACWLGLAMVLSRTLSSKTWGLAMFLTILIFSMSDRIVPWDWSIMSESLTLSFMALLFAAWVIFLQKNSWMSAATILAIQFLWVGTRDVNAWIVLVTGAITIVVYITARKPQFLVLSLFSVSMFLLSNQWVNSSEPARWQLPYTHVLTLEILPNPTASQFFINKGLPITSELLKYFRDFGPQERLDTLSRNEVQNYHEQISELYALPGFMTWLKDKGQATLGLHLLTTATTSFVKPLNEHNGYPLDRELRFGRTWDYDVLLPSALEQSNLFDPRSATGLVLLAAVTIFSAWQFIRNKEQKWIVPLASILLSYPFAFLSWHGDVLERSRHVLPADILFRLSFWIMLVYCCERLRASAAKSKSLI